MPDRQANLVAFLRAEVSSEAEADFPRLRRIPQTKVIQFLDYFDNLAAQDRASLLDALALRAAVMINPGPRPTYPSTPAFDSYWRSVTSPGPFTGGFRYCDIKTLAKIPELAEFGSYEAWIEKCQRPWVSELALQAREDLLPSRDCLTPVKAPHLRKLVKTALEARGFTPAIAKGAEHKLVHPSGAVLRVDYGSYMGQLCYHVSANCGETRLLMASFEMLWSQPGGWDYLTAENAERSITFFPELVEYLVQLPGRIMQQP